MKKIKVRVTGQYTSNYAGSPNLINNFDEILNLQADFTIKDIVNSMPDFVGRYILFDRIEILTSY